MKSVFIWFSVVEDVVYLKALFGASVSHVHPLGEREKMFVKTPLKMMEKPYAA